MDNRRRQFALSHGRHHTSGCLRMRRLPESSIHGWTRRRDVTSFQDSAVADSTNPATQVQSGGVPGDPGTEDGDAGHGELLR